MLISSFFPTIIAPVFDCTGYFQRVGKAPLAPLPTMDVFFTQSGVNGAPPLPDEVNPGSFVAVAHTINTYHRPDDVATHLSLNLHAVYVLLDPAK